MSEVVSSLALDTHVTCGGLVVWQTSDGPYTGSLVQATAEMMQGPPVPCEPTAPHEAERIAARCGAAAAIRCVCETLAVLGVDRAIVEHLVSVAGDVADGLAADYVKSLETGREITLAVTSGGLHARRIPDPNITTAKEPSR